MTNNQWSEEQLSMNTKTMAVEKLYILRMMNEASVLGNGTSTCGHEIGCINMSGSTRPLQYYGQQSELFILEGFWFGLCMARWK
jgi:hypothetical protein